jgi:hypothetical protein
MKLSDLEKPESKASGLLSKALACCFFRAAPQPAYDKIKNNGVKMFYNAKATQRLNNN